MVHKAMLQRKQNGTQTIKQAVENYLTTLTTDGKSPHYVDWLRQRLKDFYKYLQEIHGSPMLIEQVSLDDARGFIKSPMDRNIKYQHHSHREQIVNLSIE